MFGLQPNVAVNVTQVVTAQLAATAAPARRAPRPVRRCAVAVAAWRRRAPATPVRAHPGAPLRAAATWPSARIPADTRSAPPRRWCARLLLGPVDPGRRGDVLVLDSWGWDTPNDQGQVAAFLKALNIEGWALIVVDGSDEASLRSFRNLQHRAPCSHR